MSYLARNKQIFTRRWPALLTTIERSPPPREIQVTDTPDPTLFIDGIHITSSYNRLSEARLQARYVQDDSDRVVVYGFALGDLQRVLLERTAIKHLEVVVLSSAAAYQSLFHFDHTDWLTDDRIVLDHGGEKAAVQRPFAVAPATLRLADPSVEKLRDQLVLTLSAPFQKEHLARREAWLDECLQRNAVLRENDGDVHELFDSQPDGTALVIAGGPSLHDHYGWIEKSRRGKVVICVSTALRPLLGAGIVPDVVVVIDPDPKVLDHFEGIDSRVLGHTPLVYLADMYDEVLKAWPGPRLTTYFKRPRYVPLCKADPKGFLYCSGTVTHTAVDLAVKMGCKRVILFGADFCFPEGKSHVEGAAHFHHIHQPSKMRVQNGRGQQVATDISLLGFLRDLESYIANTPSVRFLKAGRLGARVQGASWLEDCHAA